MKAYLAEIVGRSPTPAHGVNLVREYLQARILGELQRAGAMIPLAFYGGTALRFLYATERFSEDLDFSLEREPAVYDLRAWLRAIGRAMTAEGYGVEIKVSDRRTVHNAFIRFPGLLHELGLSPQPRRILAVKIEADTNPPAGVVLETTVVRRHLTLQLQHHDRASFLAGKLHAILQRPFTKGRDVYDLMWYLSDPSWPSPNLALLNNALQQTGWEGAKMTRTNWRRLVGERLRTASWNRIVADVRPFLEHGANPDILTHENVMSLLV